jgi:1-acyl-sn-glycerol-3-phosphate acyltransferase
MSTEPFPPVPGYLERDPEGLFNGEFKHSPLMSRVVTHATRALIESMVILPDDLAMLQQVEGPVVLAGTHEGVSDIPVMSMVAIKGGLGPIRMISKDENFYGQGGRVSKLAMSAGGWVNRRLGAFPIDKKTMDKRWVRSLLNNSDYILQQEQKTLGIFPTGSRVDYEVGSGALNIAHRSGVPIVMVGIHGTKNDIKNLKEERKRPKIAIAVAEPEFIPKRDKARLQELHDQQKQRAIDLYEQVYAA